MSPKGFFGKIKERGITLRKSWKLGGRPVDIDHAVRKEIDRALIVGTLRKIRILLRVLSEDREKPTEMGMRKLKVEVDARIKELESYESS